MFQMVKKKLKDQRGLTLIELLAVIVILGIIAAIAIPSIMGLIDNSKQDAIVADAQQMVNSTKIAITSDKSLIPDTGNMKEINLQYLEDKGYVEPLKDPDNSTGKDANSKPISGFVALAAAATDVTTAPTNDSYVLITNTSGQLSYSVRLVNQKRGVQLTGGAPVTEDSINRSNVR